MKYNSIKNSKFSQLIRIRKNQKEWIRKNREYFGCRTDAGFLDLVINYYKRHVDNLEDVGEKAKKPNKIRG